MADTNLERKERKGAIWPWIIGLLVLLLLAWLIFGAMNRDATEPVRTGTTTADTAFTTSPTTATAETAGMSRELQQYMQTCHRAEGTEPNAMGREHEFSRNCFDLLARSMSSMASARAADPQMEQQLDTVRNRVDAIRQSDPTSMEHSGQTREAAVAAAEALATMQRAFSGTDQQAQNAVGNARDAAQQLSPSEALLNQREALLRFFREAGNALQAMGTAPRT